MSASLIGAVLVVVLLASANAGSPAPPSPPPPTIYGYVVPHSHDDVGWLLTYENYYELLVNHIYSTVVEALAANSSRRFISVEMAYFWKWWNETATATQQQQVRTFVANGQLEFIIGGWTMEDEATTTYSENIDQMTEGHQFLYETLGVRPQYGWQIDPFGSSGVVHGQFAQMGFAGTITSRIDYLLKQQWMDTKSLEFDWQPSKSQGANLSIFTHVLDVFRYTTAVGGLDWSENPIDPVTPLNEDKLCDAIIANIQERAAWFRTNRILFPWGSDFLHFIAQWDFYNMDKLMDRINSKSAQTGVIVQYATLSEFFTAVRAAANATGVTFPTFTGPDFHPYADTTYSYWSGYYSSRPALKWFVRTAEAFQRNAEVANTMAVLSGLRAASEATKETLRIGRRANGVLTHHDAVSGTSEWYVVQNYGVIGTEGMDAVAPVAEQSVAALMAQPALELSVNESVAMASLSPSHPVQITLFNSLGWSIKRYVKVSVFGSVSSVTDSTGAAVPFEVVKRKASHPFPCLYGPACGFPDSAPADLYFLATLPAVGYATFVVSASGKAVPVAPVAGFNVPTNQQGTFTLSNSFLRLTFANNTGLLLAVANLQSNLTTTMSIDLARYVPMSLDPKHNITEGAYIFHPSGAPVAIQVAPLSYEVVTGAYVSEVRQYFTAPCTDVSGQQNQTCGITQVLRLYTSPDADADFENSVELTHDLGPLRLSEDIVLQVSSQVQSGTTFYTDNNCWEAIQRTVNPAQSDPISGNFFPVTCSAFVRDSASQLLLLSDRSHSGSSLFPGRLELMLHRRIQTSDHEGPMCLNDTDRLENVQTFLVYDTPANAIRARHRLQYLQQFPPLALFSDVSAPKSASALSTDLPANIHLLSFIIPTENSTCLLRLAHIYEVGEDHDYSVPTTVVLPSVFAGNFTSLEQRSLTGTWSAAELAARDSRPFAAAAAPYSVTLNPTDIFTFYAEMTLDV